MAVGDNYFPSDQAGHKPIALWWQQLNKWQTEHEAHLHDHTILILKLPREWLGLSFQTWYPTVTRSLLTNVGTQNTLQLTAQCAAQPSFCSVLSHDTAVLAFIWQQSNTQAAACDCPNTKRQTATNLVHIWYNAFVEHHFPGVHSYQTVFLFHSNNTEHPQNIQTTENQLPNLVRRFLCPKGKICV